MLHEEHAQLTHDMLNDWPRLGRNARQSVPTHLFPEQIDLVGSYTVELGMQPFKLMGDKEGDLWRENWGFNIVNRASGKSLFEKDEVFRENPDPDFGHVAGVWGFKTKEAAKLAAVTFFAGWCAHMREDRRTGKESGLKQPVEDE